MASPSGLSNEAQELLRQRLAGLGRRTEPVPKRAGGDGVQPLSPDQRRLWFLDRLRPNRAEYNVAGAWRVRGPLRPDELEAALADVVRKQDALRSTVTVHDGEPLLRVSPPPASILIRYDVSAAEDPQAEVRRLAAETSSRPLDLEHGPLHRFWLARLGHEDHVFGLTVHHLVFDRDSLGLLLHQLVDAYERAGETPSRAPSAQVPGATATYGDYARLSWDRAQASPERLHDYWATQCDGVSAFLDLPTDHLRPPAGLSGRAGAVLTHVDSDVTAHVRALADECSTTPFAVCLAAFTAVLYRYTTATSFAVGCPFNGRQQVEFEQLIGFFTRSLPIVTRRDSATDPTYRMLVQESREAVLGAHEHQDVALEDILAAVNPTRDLSFNPLFQVWFDYAVGDVTEVAWPWEVAPFPCGETRTRFDLELHLTETSGGIEARLIYSTDLFEAETADGLLASYRRLLAAAVKEPDTRLSRLPLLGADEIETIVHSWSASSPQEDHPRA